MNGSPFATVFKKKTIKSTLRPSSSSKSKKKKTVLRSKNQQRVQGMIKAYSAKSGVWYNSKTGTVYVAGMRGTPTGIQQGIESAFMPSLLDRQGRYTAFINAMLKKKPKHVVGHSMGGIVASEGFKKRPGLFKGVDVTTINSPFTAFNPAPDFFDNQVHALDPISIFNPSARVVGDGLNDPHGFTGFDEAAPTRLGAVRTFIEDGLAEFAPL